MRIIVYNSSSFGGCFDYGKCLVRAYKEHSRVSRVSWWIPVNAEAEPDLSTQKIFISDKPTIGSRIGKQVHFLWRTLINPFLLLQKLSMEPPSVVLFNDFEQLSALIWAPFFSRTLRKKHRFVVLLHDPDRDAYPPNLWFTQLSMKRMMRLMDVAIYHDFLPTKVYYDDLSNCRFLDLPHGFYPMPDPDENLLAEIQNQIEVSQTLITIPGNIREEKNYHLAIEALQELSNYVLLIAGNASNARVDINQYKDLAQKLGVSDRIIWIERFLTEKELAAVIEISDVVVLNYAVSFTSQSGILNVVAPFRKKLIVSNGPSSLASVLKKFKVGELVEPGSVQALIEGLVKLEKEDVELRQNWEDYLGYASWENHVEKAVGCFHELN